MAFMEQKNCKLTAACKSRWGNSFNNSGADNGNTERSDSATSSEQHPIRNVSINSYSHLDDGCNLLKLMVHPARLELATF